MNANDRLDLWSEARAGGRILTANLAHAAETHRDGIDGATSQKGWPNTVEPACGLRTAARLNANLPSVEDDPGAGARLVIAECAHADWDRHTGGWDVCLEPAVRVIDGTPLCDVCSSLYDGTFAADLAEFCAPLSDAR